MLRYVFSDEQLEIVTRNIEDVLYFHEQFVSELREDLSPLGFFMADNGEVRKANAQDSTMDDSTDDSFEAAITAVAKKFSSQVR